MTQNCRTILSVILTVSILWATSVVVIAGDASLLVSSLVTNGTVVMPRTIFKQVWTIQNTGTTTWTAKQAGYKLNLVGTDTLGAVPYWTNSIASWYGVWAIIDSGKSIAPGSTATFSMSFIAPEAAGTYTDTFQLYNASSNVIGSPLTMQIVVPQAGSTNQYDRCRAICYANTYAGYVCSDGYFWTNSSVSDVIFYGDHAPVPTAELGDDCAHFVSSCIGSQSVLRGGGLNIVTRVSPSYGEPGAQRLIYTNLVAAGYAVEVASVTNLLPGDLVGWNWEGDTNTANVDHVTLYLGNNLTASHAESALDVGVNTFFQSGEKNWKYHLIHILDSPTINSSKVGTNLILSWGTNWTGYTLYSSPDSTTWTKVSKAPIKNGRLNMMTNSMSSTGSMFYRLSMP